MKQNPPSNRGNVYSPVPGESVSGEVLTYDPVRRQGYLKLNPPGMGRAFFRLSDLPATIKGVIVDESRKINKAKKEAMPAQEFKKLLHDIGAHLIGRRFRFEVKATQTGKLILKKGTIEISAA